MSLVQVFHCNQCGFAFGPVGVQPYNPESAKNQLWMTCNGCNSPSGLYDDPRNITSRCSVCDACDWRNLNACPECNNAGAEWMSPEQVAASAAERMQYRQAVEGAPQEYFGDDYQPPDEFDEDEEAFLAELEAKAATERPTERPVAQAAESIVIEYVKLGGCMGFFLGVMTVGVAPLMIWLTMRKWPVYADNAGVVLKNGTHIPWTRIQRFVHVTTNVSGTVVHKFTFELDKGKWELPCERLKEPQKVLDFILPRVPEHARRMEN